MSRRSSLRNNNGILLDTSFLLPVLGFNTSIRIMKAFQKLGSYELYYNDISILEALWKIVKIIKGTKNEITRIKEGVEALANTVKYVAIDKKAVENAIHMYILGHRDLVDNILYSIAVSKNLKLLTVDKELIKFIKRHSLNRESIILPEELE